MLIRNFGTFIALVSVSTVQSQITGYVAAKSMLSLREQPNAQYKVIGKIPYGEKITYYFENKAESIVTEGFVGDWVKTSYKGITGYVFSTYLLPFPPPKQGTLNMIDYFKQISQPFGQPLILKEKPKDEEIEITLSKQMFKNGFEFHESMRFEFVSTTYFLPKLDVQKAYLLLCLIPEFTNLVSEKEVFYRNSSEFKIEYGTKKVYNDKEDYGTSYRIKKIRIEREDGAFQFLEIFDLSGQIVIHTGVGV